MLLLISDYVYKETLAEVYISIKSRSQLSIVHENHGEYNITPISTVYSNYQSLYTDMNNCVPNSLISFVIQYRDNSQKIVTS